MSRCGRWQCSQVTRAGKGRGQLRSGGCVLALNSGNLPALPCLRRNGASFKRGTVFLLCLFSDWFYTLEPN